MKNMENLDDHFLKQIKFIESLEKASNKILFEQKIEFKNETPDVFHLNSLITKNIYLFTKIQTINCIFDLYFRFLYFHYLFWSRHL